MKLEPSPPAAQTTSQCTYLSWKVENESALAGRLYQAGAVEGTENEGTIEVLNRMDLYFTPQLLGGKAPDRVKARQLVHLNGPKDFNERDGAINHFRNWVEAIRGNEQVIASPEVGQQAAISGHMATLSFKNNRKIMWDEAGQKYQLV